MNSTEKMKGTAIVVFIIFSILFFVQIIQWVRVAMPAFYTLHGDFTWGEGSAILLLYFFLGLAFHIALCVIFFLLLQTLLKDETPFKKKTTILLKLIALFFIYRDMEGIIYSIYVYFQFRSEISEMAYLTCPSAIENIEHMTTSILYFGGFSIIAGLIIYLISLVVDYGISLQTQVDETL